MLGADDNPSIGRALSVYLGREADVRWIGSLPSADELIEAVARLTPDVVLLDIDMPGRDPFEALADLSSSSSPARVIILSGHVRRELIDQAFGAGAWGYISKNDELSEIVAALRRVMTGEVVMSTEVAAALAG